jgi:ribonuclease H2 subunit A
MKMDDPMEESQEVPDLEQETPSDDVFVAPSIHKADLIAGVSYSHVSPVPELLKEDMTTECVLGVDEAGRGPVLGNDS